MKGIILAGGSGTRLYPMTKGISKQLLPIHDKPMIYYPLSILMLAGIKKILIISTPSDLPNFIRLLGDGSDFGLEISYEQQVSPRGLAEAFIIGEKFIGTDRVCLILGDNIFYGHSLSNLLKKNIKKKKGATIFAYHVSDPKRFGVVEFDKNKKVISIKEKPKKPKSNYAVTGLYFYDNRVVKIAKKLKPSERGELEITDINNAYLRWNNLDVEIMGRGFAWLDTGTVETLSTAGYFVKAIEESQGLKIGCLEEIAFKNGWINIETIKKKKNFFLKTSYGKYVLETIVQAMK